MFAQGLEGNCSGRGAHSLFQFFILPCLLWEGRVCWNIFHAEFIWVFSLLKWKRGKCLRPRSKTNQEPMLLVRETWRHRLMSSCFRILSVVLEPGHWRDLFEGFLLHVLSRIWNVHGSWMFVLVWPVCKTLKICGGGGRNKCWGWVVWLCRIWAPQGKE